MTELILIRHGETEWSRSGQYTGRTDLPLTDAGMAAARALAPVLARRQLAAVVSSPLSRAMRTAELAGLTGAEPDPGLLEWDYGGYEGMTEKQIRQARPGWDLWRDGVIPGGAGHPGETLQQVATRIDAVLERVRPLLRHGDVALVGHGHLQRVLTARWLGLDPSAGRLFGHPQPGTLSGLGTEGGQAVISAWNIRQRMSAVSLRPATPADSEFCYQLHKAAMGGYVAAIWGWDERIQRDFQARAFQPERWQIITAGGTDIGMIDVEYRPGELYLARIEILPEHQGQGIGTRLISALAEQASRNGQDLVLDVLTVNHRARALYRRLGLTEVTRHGPGNIKITMRSGRPDRSYPG